jgi:GNAT superfamily N-acetyltransferase
VTAVGPEYLADVLRLFAQTWWTVDRDAEDVRRMLETSVISIGLYDEKERRLIAYGRALTDGVFKAVLVDVIVAEEHRGRGLGRRVASELMKEAQGQGVRELELYCNPRHGHMYAELGFSVPDETVFMRLLDSDRQCGRTTWSASPPVE